jgi:CBS domain-containing membrane protein
VLAVNCAPLIWPLIARHLIAGENMITIADFMTRELHTLGPQDTLYQARALMMEAHIRHVPIVDEGGAIIGLVTHRDVLAAADSDLAEFDGSERVSRESEVPLAQVMTTGLISVDETVGLRAAALHLQKYKHGCLPVLAEDGKLVGIITDTDYVAIAIDLLEQLEENEPDDVDG